ncbi:MAG: low molecular weight protein-tyrosine-phosphatase [Pseudomonadota bacterium]
MRILFVCLGNICRSPTAEAVARAHGLDCDSAGTGGWHVGAAPYAPMQRAADARGIDMSTLRARQFHAGDFTTFDLIIAMDTDNLRAIEALRPPSNQTPVRLLTDYGESGDRCVPDPYYTRDFEGALALIEDCIQGLARSLQCKR